MYKRIIIFVLAIYAIYLLFRLNMARVSKSSINSVGKSITKHVPRYDVDEDPLCHYLRCVLSDVRQKIPETADVSECINDKIELVESKKPVTYVRNKREINIVIKINGSTFDTNTMVYVALHEYAHVLCTQKGHGPLFKEIENMLLAIANDLGYYNKDKPVDKSYPCVMV